MLLFPRSLNYIRMIPIIVKERKIAEDALDRNLERKTVSKRKQQSNNSGESCSSAKEARNDCFRLQYNTIQLSPASYFLNGTMTD